jgi:hypothetical protein
MTYVVQPSQNPVLGIMESGRINFPVAINNHLNACWVQPMDESNELANKCYEKALSPTPSTPSFPNLLCFLGLVKVKLYKFDQNINMYNIKSI